MALTIPVITTDMSTLDAALAYGAAGSYIGPLRRGTKHPGSRLGPRWQQKTSRDPEVITAWFAGSDDGLFLHVGRSGAVVLYVDDPTKLPPSIRQAVEQHQPPFQSTRVEVPERGHYVFTQPVGRDLGNSLGALGGGWGEIRGRNGVIVVAPSDHASGGRYEWQQTGLVPVLLGDLASKLPDALEAAKVATDRQVAAFLAQHSAGSRPELLDLHVASYWKAVRSGESRHDSMSGRLAGAIKEAAVGLLDAKLAADTLESVFLEAVAQQPCGAKQGAPRVGAAAVTEWRGLLAWAVAQGVAADPAATLARVEDKVPAQVTEVPWPNPGSTTGRDPDEDTDEDPDARTRRIFPRLDWHKLWLDDTEEEWIHEPLLPARRSVTIYAPPKAWPRAGDLGHRRGPGRPGRSHPRPPAARARRVSHTAQRLGGVPPGARRLAGRQRLHPA